VVVTGAFPWRDGVTARDELVKEVSAPETARWANLPAFDWHLLRRPHRAAPGARQPVWALAHSTFSFTVSTVW